MTQPLHLDLDAVQHRYDLANETPPGEPGETMLEWRERVDLELVSRAWACVEDIPDLVAEIRRLQQLLQQAHADADELLYPNTSRDPDWYIRQQGADEMFHRMGDEP